MQADDDVPHPLDDLLDLDEGDIKKHLTDVGKLSLSQTLYVKTHITELKQNIAPVVVPGLLS